MVDQRLLMYIVISMPKRMSIASGVSHFIIGLLWTDGQDQSLVGLIIRAPGPGP
jgi:hypothetical protein